MPLKMKILITISIVFLAFVVLIVNEKKVMGIFRRI